MIRKAQWMFLAALFAAIAAPCVRADTVAFTCTGESGGAPCLVAVPTAPSVAFPGPTLVITWASQVFDIALPSDWQDTDSYFWGASNNFFGLGDYNHPFDLEPFATINTDLPGIGGVSEGGVVTFTPGSVATPEPASSALALLGVGLLGLMMAMRKRISLNHQHAS